jgi:delta8-fatty-acid desaturase
MQRYRIGRIEGAWVNFTPPIQGGSFRKHDHHDVAEVELSSQHAKEPIFEDAAVVEARLSPSDYTTSQVQHDIEADLAKYPSLDADTQRIIKEKFQALHQRLKDERFYDCRFSEYGKEILRYATLFALFVFFLRRAWYTTSACFLGLFWHQIMFTAHDAGI